MFTALTIGFHASICSCVYIAGASRYLHQKRQTNQPYMNQFISNKALKNSSSPLISLQQDFENPVMRMLRTLNYQVITMILLQQYVGKFPHKVLRLDCVKSLTFLTRSTALPGLYRQHNLNSRKRGKPHTLMTLQLKSSMQQGACTSGTQLSRNIFLKVKLFIHVLTISIQIMKFPRSQQCYLQRISAMPLHPACVLCKLYLEHI